MNKEYCRKYYLFDSLEDIQIQHPNGNIELRPVMVAGMKRHTPEQLAALRAKAIWTVTELRELEGW